MISPISQIRSSAIQCMKYIHYSSVMVPGGDPPMDSQLQENLEPFLTSPTHKLQGVKERTLFFALDSPTK